MANREFPALTPPSLVSGVSLPPGCQECGLYAQGVNPWLHPIYDDRAYVQEDWPNVLILDQHPSWKEDQRGQRLVNERMGHGFLMRFLYDKDVKFRWTLAGAVRCYPGKGADYKEAKPNLKQIQLCSTYHLSDVIRRFPPAVVICLGAVALQSVWGSSVSSIKAFGCAPRQHELGHWVIALQHPSVQMQGFTDLTEHYIAGFETAVELAWGKTQAFPTYQKVDDTRDMIKRLRTLPDKLAVDVETNTHDVSSDRRTTWHEGTRMLCLGIAYRDQSGKIEVLSLRPPVCNDVMVLREVFRGRKVVFHAAKADIQMIWVPTGVCVWKLAREVVCTLQISTLRDQSRAGNGLKELLALVFHWADYSSSVWEDVSAANAQRTELRKHITKEATKIRRLLKSKESDKLNRIEVMQAQNTLQFIMARIAEIQPDCGFECVDPEKIAFYNACDVAGTLKLEDEWLPDLPEDDQPTALGYQLGMRITEICTYVERVGIPISRPHYEALRSTVEAKIKDMKKAMLRCPEVWEALSQLKDVQEAARKGRLTEEFVSDYINVKSINFYGALAKATMGARYVAQMERTDPSKSYPEGQLKSSWEYIERLSGENPLVKPELREHRHWIWWLFGQLRELRDMGSRFFDSVVEKYAVPDAEGTLRVHTDYIVARVEIPGQEAGADRGGGASTGRISSRSPNCQNVKKDSIIRYVIRPPKGRVICEIDFSSIEPVVLAVESQCVAWLEIFRRGLDLYRCAANDAKKLGISLEGDDVAVKLLLEQRIDKALRSLAKVTVLAKMYYERPEAMAARMGISVQEAVDFGEGFDLAYPEIGAWQAWLWDRVVAGEKIDSRFGRLRSFPHYGDIRLDERTKRQLVNYPIQSCASDINLWMVWELDRELKRKGLDRYARIFNVVHDSATLECDRGACWEVMALAQNVMQDRNRLPFDFPCPLRTAVTIGTDMGQMLNEKALVSFQGFACTADAIPKNCDIHFNQQTEKFYAVPRLLTLS